MSFKKIVYGMLLTSALIISSGCDSFPRGESQSLEDVVRNARQRYSEVKSVEVPEAVAADLKAILSALESMEKSKEVDAATFSDVAKALSSLLPHAGYTVRPAMSELMKQHLAMSNERKPGYTASLLLASRTYSVLATELETTGFQL